MKFRKATNLFLKLKPFSIPLLWLIIMPIAAACSDNDVEKTDSSACMEACNKHYDICGLTEQCDKDCDDFKFLFSAKYCAQWIDAYNSCILNASSENWNCLNEKWSIIFIDECKDEANAMAMCKYTLGEPCADKSDDQNVCETTGKPPILKYCINQDLAFEGCVPALSNTPNGAYCCP